MPITEDDVIINQLMDAAGKVYDVNENYVLTKLLPIDFDEGTAITARVLMAAVCCFGFFDADEKLLLAIGAHNCADYGYEALKGLQTVSIIPPAGAKYIRISANTYNMGGGPWYTKPSDLFVTCVKTNSLPNMVADLEEKHTHDMNAVARQINANLTDFRKVKTLVFGDSITADYYGQYPKWVTALINSNFFSAANVNNNSVHATGFVARLSDTEADDFITRMEAVKNPETYQLVIVFGGINDYMQDVPIGTSTDDKTTHFAPAVDYFFSTLATKFVNARIAVLLPLRTAGYGGVNDVGSTQAEYAEYIHKVAKDYAFPTLNLMDESGYNPKLPAFNNRWSLTDYVGSDGVTGDTIHPNEEFERRFLAKMISGFLRNIM